MEVITETRLPSRLLKATEVAQILNVSKAFVYQLMQKGELPTVKILGARRVRTEDLSRFIEENIDIAN
jgi:excisionase family DNA binding protein